MKILLLATLAAMSLASAASAQHHGGHHGHDGAKPMSEAAAAYKAANDKMHKEMTMNFTGDADIDLLNGMIPHHKGAIDMANVALKYGKDPEVRRLAEQIIKAQKEEIAMMETMLKRLKK